MATVINAILFQLTWFSAVLGGAAMEPWWGIPGLVGLVAFSAWRRTLRVDAVLVGVLVLVGWGLEAAWIDLGVLFYGQGGVPVWILVLWVGVALTINHSLLWFQRYPFCGAALAALAAPLCYLGGERLGAVVVPDPLNLIWVSLVWLLIFQGIFRFAPYQLESLGRFVTVRR